ncbi:MAG TPA: carbohydrate kinase family protein [Thermoanaerobaculia bacterium]|nr:carbohydrate kinase family protein [Thermoanaerobaculia bacterium]
MNKNANLWQRLSDFASGIRLDSISVGPFGLSFGSVRPSTPAFTEILQHVNPLEGCPAVLVVSAQNVDEVTVVDRIDPNHECEALRSSIKVCGGSGANTAFALSRLGLGTTIAGIVGDDADGRMLARELVASGVNTSLLLTGTELPTGRTTTLVEEGGQRLIVVHPGINDRYAARVDSSRLIEVGHASKIVHVSSFVGQAELALQQKLVSAVGSHSVVSLTPGAIYARQGLDRLRELLRHVDVIFLYREQLVTLIENSSASGVKAGDRPIDYLNAFFEWRRRSGLTSPIVVVVKDPLEVGAGKMHQKFLSVAVGRDQVDYYIAPQELPKGLQLRVVDTTGAGDAVAAGFLFGIFRQAPLEACLDFAFLLAAYSSTELGARTAFMGYATDLRGRSRQIEAGEHRSLGPQLLEGELHEE